MGMATLPIQNSKFFSWSIMLNSRVKLDQSTKNLLTFQSKTLKLYETKQ